MKGTLYTVADLALWMRVPREEVERMVEEDGMPCLRLPGDARPKIKFAPRHLWEWLNETATKRWMKIEDLISDIDYAISSAANERKAGKGKEREVA